MTHLLDIGYETGHHLYDFIRIGEDAEDVYIATGAKFYLTRGWDVVE